MGIRSIAAAASLVASIGVASIAGGAEPGTIKGRFVYSGKDEGGKVTITKDTEYCGKHEPNDETVELGENGGLRNVFVYLSLKKGAKIEITAEYAGEQKPAVLDNKGCRFEPHAMTMWTKQKLEIKNSDDVGHNTNAMPLAAGNVSFNQLISKENPYTVEFKNEERFPAKFACNIHPWMTAYVLVRDNPYMAVSGEDGSFEIKGVPAGKHEFALWHEAVGYVRDLEVDGKKTDRKGLVTLEASAGKTLDLGDIKVAPKQIGK